MAKAEQVLWYLNCLATIALLAQMMRCGLRRTYFWLFLYWSGQVLTDLVMFCIPLHSNLYASFYFSSQFLNLVLAVLGIHELFQIALARHPGLSAFGRKGLLVVLGVAAFLALGGLGLDFNVLPGQYLTIHRFLTLSRTVEFVLLVFLLAVSAFLIWFPVRTQRNVAVYIAVFLLFYASQSFLFLLQNRLPQAYSQIVSVAALTAALLSLTTWLVGIRRESQSQDVVVGHSWDPAAAARLSVQLDGINAALVRFSRRATG